MNRLLIGCGGWAYADFGNLPGTKLENYSKLFNFVEINSTFYTIPKESQCHKWKKSVPEDFTFAIKCNREISHIQLLKPNKRSLELFEQMVRIYKILNPIALVIQTPSSFLKNVKNLENASDFFSTIDSPINLVWEVRGIKHFKKLQPELLSIFSKYNITHCSDISRYFPIYTTNLFYTRIFGYGKQNMWQFDDEEIKVLQNRVENVRKNKDVVVSFHTMRMEKDSARYQEFSSNNTLIPVTDFVGLNSLMSVIMEYSKFPISKDELMEAHGWKIIDLTHNIRIRASKILNKLPNQQYSSLKNIEHQLQRIFDKNKQKQLDQFIK